MKVEMLNKVEKLIVSKGVIARYEQFFLLSQYFKMSSAVEASESIYMSEKGAIKNRH